MLVYYYYYLFCIITVTFQLRIDETFPSLDKAAEIGKAAAEEVSFMVCIRPKKIVWLEGEFETFFLLFLEQEIDFLNISCLNVLSSKQKEES